MNVQYAMDFGEGHLIEIGESTWYPVGARSIREGWPTSKGGFSPHSSNIAFISQVSRVIGT